MSPIPPAYRPRWAMAILNLLLLAASSGLAATASSTPVSSYAELVAALNNPSVGSISVTKPIAMPHNSTRPAVVNRQLLITSPMRAIIDWCNPACRQAKGPASPHIILGQVSRAAE